MLLCIHILYVEEFNLYPLSSYKHRLFSHFPIATYCKHGYILLFCITIFFYFGTTILDSLGGFQEDINLLCIPSLIQDETFGSSRFQVPTYIFISLLITSLALLLSSCHSFYRLCVPILIIHEIRRILPILHLLFSLLTLPFYFTFLDILPIRFLSILCCFSTGYLFLYHFLQVILGSTNEIDLVLFKTHSS